MTAIGPILLPFPPSGWKLYRSFRGGRARNAKYERWITEAGVALASQTHEKFTVPVRLDMAFGLPDARARDIENFVKPVVDLLVRHQVIQDDNTTWLRAFTARVADGFKGVKVRVEPVDDYDAAERKAGEGA